MVWNLLGFYMVLFVAAIHSVPAEIVEAARLDGCGRLRLSVVQVILPTIRDNVSTAAVYMGIGRTGHVRVHPGDDPQRRDRQEHRGHLPDPCIRRHSSTRASGTASAMGVVLALVTMLMAVIVLFGFRRKDV